MKDIPIRLSFSHLPRVVMAGLVRVQADRIIPERKLRHFEIDYVSSGGGRTRCNGHPFTLRPGHAYIYRKGDRYERTGGPRGEEHVCRYVQFECRAMGNLRGATETLTTELPHEVKIPLRQRRGFQEVLDQLLTFYAEGRPGWDLGASGALLTLFSLLTDASKAAGDTADKAKGGIDRRLGAAIAYMEKNLRKRMMIGEIAAAAGLSEDYFGRLFRKAMGCSPLQYLIRLRAQEGRRLLILQTELTMQQAAGLAGFDDARYFSRVFRRQFGMSPGEFRRSRDERWPG